MKTDKKKKGLGRGLDALFESTVPVTPPEKTGQSVNTADRGNNLENSNENTVDTNNSIFYIDINHIKPNAKQPRKYFDDEKIEGVVLSMFDGRTNLSVQVVQEVKKYFGSKVYTTVIPRNIRLAEAPSYGMAITEYDPKSRGAEAYTEFAHEFLERAEKK